VISVASRRLRDIDSAARLDSDAETADEQEQAVATTRADHLAAINRITRAINSSLDLKQVYRTVAI
jgi:hypothetical protein